jgi:hypothetical protein
MRSQSKFEIRNSKIHRTPTPNYTDTFPFPPAPVKWTYQAIYHVADHRIGQSSKPVSVTVGG